MIRGSTSTRRPTSPSGNASSGAHGSSSARPHKSPQPGDYVATEIAGAKVVAIRADDGVLRAFRNVCVHRGARLLEEGTGHCHAIQCPYHHWLYGLDGTLKRTPWFGEDPDFDMADWPLQQISVDEWRGLLFVAIDPVEPLLANLGDTIGVLADEPIETFQLYRTERLVFDANWKIYVDNFIEGYHIPGIHPSFYAAIDFEKFETVAMDNVIKMTAPRRTICSIAARGSRRGPTGRCRCSTAA